MIYALNIILFLTYLYGLGYSLTRFEKSGNIEINVMRIGLGLGIFPVLGVLLDFFNMPVDWRIFLVISLGLPVFDSCRWAKSNLRRPKFKMPRVGWHFFLLLLILIFCVVCYCYGPFTYPWLESDDSWFHAASIKYISVERNIQIPSGIFQYINPYPPGYDLVIAIMHQTTPSLYFTLKLFNGFIVSLGILFFYFFVKKFAGNKNKALIATFFLGTIPCYLSHYIWSHSLAVTLFIPAFYLILRAKEDKRYSFPAGIVVGGILLTQPTQPIKFMAMLLLFFGAVFLIEKRVRRRLIIIPIIGGLVAFAWYGHVLKEYRGHNLKRVSASGARELKDIKMVGKFASGLFSPSGGATTRSHKIYHYLFPPLRNDRNNPVGVGIVICFFILLGIISCFHLAQRGGSEEKIYAITTLSWLAFTFLGCNSRTFSLPIGLFAYRFWALFAIPASILAAEALWEYMSSMNKIIKKIFLAMVIIGVVCTSAYPKFVTNTYIWRWGVFWSSAREMKAYLWMRYNLKPNTKVFAYVNNKFVIGHDMRSDYWSTAYEKSFKNAITFDALKLRNALRKNDYEYIVIGGRDFRRFGRKVVQQKVREVKASGLFEVVFEIKNSIWILKVL